METALIVTGIVATLAVVVWYIHKRSTLKLLYVFVCVLFLCLSYATVVQHSLDVLQLEHRLYEKQREIEHLQFYKDEYWNPTMPCAPFVSLEDE